MEKALFDIALHKDMDKIINIKESILNLIDKRNIFPYYKVTEDKDEFCIFIYPLNGSKLILNNIEYIYFSKFYDLEEVYSSLVDEYTKIDSLKEENKDNDEYNTELITLFMHNDSILNKLEFEAKMNKIRNNIRTIYEYDNSKPLILDYVLDINIMTYSYIKESKYNIYPIDRYNLLIYNKKDEHLKELEIIAYCKYLEDELNNNLDDRYFRVILDFYNIRETDW